MNSKYVKNINQYFISMEIDKHPYVAMIMVSVSSVGIFRELVALWKYHIIRLVYCKKESIII